MFTNPGSVLTDVIFLNIIDIILSSSVSCIQLIIFVKEDATMSMSTQYIHIHGFVTS